MVLEWMMGTLTLTTFLYIHSLEKMMMIRYSRWLNYMHPYGKLFVCVALSLCS
jgi:hypothetical protein